MGIKASATKKTVKVAEDKLEEEVQEKIKQMTDKILGLVEDDRVDIRNVDRLTQAITHAIEKDDKCWCGNDAVLFGWCYDHLPVRAGYSRYEAISADEGIDQIDRVLFDASLVDFHTPHWIVIDQLKDYLNEINKVVQAVKQR